MTTPKFQNVWSALHRYLLEENIPHAMIGALALAQYGIARYTAGIDLLADFRGKHKIMQMMETLNFDDFVKRQFRCSRKKSKINVRKIFRNGAYLAVRDMTRDAAQPRSINGSWTFYEAVFIIPPILTGTERKMKWISAIGAKVSI